MANKFPGIDPFIEGQRWPRLHAGMIVEIARQLNRQFRPRYVCQIEERVYLERDDDPADFRRPDLHVVTSSPGSSPLRGSGVAAVAEPRMLELPDPVEETERFIEIHSLPGRELVAVLEVLSPSNKRRGSDGRAAYLRGRTGVLASSAHLVEIDLLRGGEPVPTRPRLPHRGMYVLVSPAEQRPKTFAYDADLRAPLPTVAVPLKPQDSPVALNLQSAYEAIYEDLAFDDDLDRTALDPPLSPEDAAWVAERLAAA
jgi:hypothetical protein